jgi:archaellum component FlaF (FlaF/FlaG flagellin family)
MENGIPALVIAAILMLSTVFMARGGFLGIDAVGQSLRQSNERMEQQKRSGINITSATIDGSGANITLTLQNDGQTPIADFSRMDVVVQYFDEVGTRFDKWIPYTSGALASDTWTTGVFTNDVFEPGILNNGESVEMLIRVNPVVGVGTTNWIIVGTEQAVTATAYFAGPP